MNAKAQKLFFFSHTKELDHTFTIHKIQSLERVVHFSRHTKLLLHIVDQDITLTSNAQNFSSTDGE